MHSPGKRKNAEKYKEKESELNEPSAKRPRGNEHYKQVSPKENESEKQEYAKQTHVKDPSSSSSASISPFSALSSSVLIRSPQKQNQNHPGYRVKTYNILAAPLARKEWFIKAEEGVLDPAFRFELLKTRLQTDMDEGCILNLQEVSIQDYGRLLQLFGQNQYTFIHNSYGTERNGYMGCGIAFPNYLYELAEQAEIVHVSDEIGKYIVKKQVKPVQQEAENQNVQSVPNVQTDQKEKEKEKEKEKKKAKGPGFFSRLANKVFCRSSAAKKEEEKNMFAAKPAPVRAFVFDTWKYALNKWNSMLFLCLRSKETGQVFGNAVYHMPCNFDNNDVMLIHAIGMMECVQKLAQKYQVPYVLAVDGNFKPDSECYKFLLAGFSTCSNEKQDENQSEHQIDKEKEKETIGNLKANDQEANIAFARERLNSIKSEMFDINWRPNVHPSQSAYLAFYGKEPECTNYCHIKDRTEPFSSTLDYLFISSDFKVAQVDEIVPPTSLLPNKEEPSDHLAVTAQLVF